MSAILHSAHNNVAPHIATPMLFVVTWFSAMANIAIPGMAVAYRALLSRMSCTSTGLSKHGVGVGPLVCLDFWDRGRVCPRGGGGATRTFGSTPPLPSVFMHS